MGVLVFSMYGQDADAKKIVLQSLLPRTLITEDVGRSAPRACAQLSSQGCEAVPAKERRSLFNKKVWCTLGGVTGRSKSGCTSVLILYYIWSADSVVSSALQIFSDFCEKSGLQCQIQPRSTCGSLVWSPPRGQSAGGFKNGGF